MFARKIMVDRAGQPKFEGKWGKVIGLRVVSRYGSKGRCVMEHGFSCDSW